MRCYNCKNSNMVRIDKDWTCKRYNTCLQEDKERLQEYSNLNIKPGSKIRFKDEKKFWTVRAADNRFIIAYRNYKKDYYYVICDLKECIRGADNYCSCGGYYDYKNCPEIELREALYRLHLEEDKPIKDCKDLPEDIRQKLIKEHSWMCKYPEEEILSPLNISYRNWTNLNIEEVK